MKRTQDAMEITKRDNTENYTISGKIVEVCSDFKKTNT